MKFPNIRIALFLVGAAMHVGIVPCATAQIVLDNFNSGTRTGAVVSGVNGASWVGSITQNPTTITVGSPATDTNGYGVTGLNLNASAMTYVRITAQRDTGNVNPSFVVTFEDTSLNSAIFSVSSAAFTLGTLTQVQIPISSWGAGFDATQIGGWSIGGGSVGTTAFRMTFDNLALGSSLLPLTGGGTIITAGNQVYTTAINLDAATTLGAIGSGGNAITFNSTINGNHSLTLNTPGTTTLGGAVGNTTPIGNLTIDAGGTTVINGGTVKTTGAQTYNDPVSLGANTLFESISGGIITFVEALVGNGYSMEFRTDGAGSFRSASGLSSFTKSGAGTLTLTGASTYTGPTIISAGRIVLGVNNALPTTSALTLSGGTLALGGYTQTLGLLSLTANSTLDFGGVGGTLSFANSSAQTWSGTLSITNYTTATDSLRFGSSSSALTPTQLSLIRFADFGNAIGQIDASGFVSPIPEPSTYAAIFGAVVLGFAVWRRRKSKENS